MINLIGTMSVHTPCGQNLTPRGQKARAICAVLCLSRDGARQRKWLQDLLWSDRGDTQGAASLRSCLSDIRRSFGKHRDILITDKHTVGLDLSQILIDLSEMSAQAWRVATADKQELLEGFDIRDPEFEDWLRTQRSMIHNRMAAAASGTATQYQLKKPDVMPSQELSPDWRLAIAVLPLLNQTEDADARFVAEGLSEDLIDRLQRVRWLPVIAKSSSFSGESNKHHSNSAFVQTLGALYYVDGSLRRGKRGMNVRFRLAETGNDHVIWSDTFELDSLIEDELDQLLDHVISQISRNVEQTYQRRMLLQPARKMDYLDHVWRGRWHLGQFSKRDAARSYAHLSSALELQPNGPEAMIQMGYWHLWRAWATRDPDDGMYELAAQHARNAAAIDSDDGRCLAILGTVMFWRCRHGEAETLFRQALDIMPSLALAHQQLGTVLNYADRPGEATASIRAALRYSPRDLMEFGYQTELAAALSRIGELEEAWERATMGVSRKPRYWYAHLIRILVARKLGDNRRVTEARESMAAANVRPTHEHLNWLPLGRSVFRDELASTIDQNI